MQFAGSPANNPVLGSLASGARQCLRQWRTNEGTAHGRFTRATARRNLFLAEFALREMGTPSLLVALGYLDLLADLRPDKFDRAAVRWYERLEAATRPQAEAGLVSSVGPSRLAP